MTSIIGAIAHPYDTFKRGASYVAEQALGLLPDRISFRPKLPPYTEIPAAERARALVRGQGQAHVQPAIDGGEGDSHEPVSLYVTGTQEELQAALEAQGWSKAHELSLASGVLTVLSMLDRITSFRHIFDFNFKGSPVSDMYLHGNRSVAAFNKNNQHNLARDHLRVFATSEKSPDGRPVWAIAASRDDGMHLQPRKFDGFHSIDKAIDRERDLVMADMLASGNVADWRIVAGAQSAADAAHFVKSYVTDNKVYLVDLKTRAALAR
jgi:hypothetical protein